MNQRWFDATKQVQAKGPFDTPGPAAMHGISLPDHLASKGYYIVLERDGTTRPITAEGFEERYQFDGDSP